MKWVSNLVHRREWLYRILPQVLPFWACADLSGTLCLETKEQGGCHSEENGSSVPLIANVKTFSEHLHDLLEG